jgi:hypothetical protein
MTKVDRYDFRSKHHGTEVVVKSREGKWVKASDYDALTADNARLRQRIQNQTDQINGLERSRRGLESLMAGADRRVELVEADSARLREVLAPVMEAAAKFSEEPVMADNFALLKAVSNMRVVAGKARAALTGKETK